VVHGKARRESSIGADDEPVLSGAASPVLADTAHKALHVSETRNRIDHLPTLTLFVDEPIKKLVHYRKVFWPDVSVIFVEMLEMTLLHHRSLVDVECDRDSVFVGDGGELFHVLNVRAADVGIEKQGVSVAVLSLHEVLEVRSHMFKGFRQPGLFLDGIDSKVDCRYAGVGETVRDFRP